MQPTPGHHRMTRIWGRHAAAAGGGVLGAALWAAPGWAAGTPVDAAPGLAWGIPFVGLLLSIALVPLAAPHFWHRRMPLVAEDRPDGRVWHEMPEHVHSPVGLVHMRYQGA